MLESLGPRNVGGLHDGRRLHGRRLHGRRGRRREASAADEPAGRRAHQCGRRLCRVARGPDDARHGCRALVQKSGLATRKYAPYQIKLDDSENLIFAPKDRDDVIRLVGSGADAR